MAKSKTGKLWNSSPQNSDPSSLQSPSMHQLQVLSIKCYWKPVNTCTDHLCVKDMVKNMRNTVKTEFQLLKTNNNNRGLIVYAQAKKRHTFTVYASAHISVLIALSAESTMQSKEVKFKLWMWKRPDCLFGCLDLMWFGRCDSPWWATFRGYKGGMAWKSWGVM